jgi:O-antigen/teichoic acid export membrane protein
VTETAAPRRIRAMSGALDQAFSSISNGIIVFATAVAASPDEFGQITILMTMLFVVLAALRGGLGILLLQTANRPAEEIRRGGSNAVFWGFVVTPVLSLTMLAFIPSIGLPALALAVFTPFVLAQDVLRYVAMTIGRPQIAALWDGIWCVGAFTALGCAWLQLSFVSAGSVLAWWGFLGLIAFIAMAVSLRVWPRRRGALAWLKTDVHHRIRFAIDATLEQTSLLVIFVLMTAFIGAAATGALRGAMALFAPIGIIGAAVQIVLIPESARSSASPRKIWRMLTPLTIYTALFTAALGIGFYFVPPNLGFYLLGESWGAAHAVLIPTTMWFTAACLAVVQALFLRTLNLSREVLQYKIVGTITQLLAAGIASAFFRTTTAVAISLTIATIGVAVFYLFHWPPWRAEKRIEPDVEPDVAVEDPVSPAALPIVIEVPHPDSGSHEIASTRAQLAPPSVARGADRRPLVIGAAAVGLCAGLLLAIRRLRGPRAM